MTTTSCPQTIFCIEKDQGIQGGNYEDDIFSSGNLLRILRSKAEGPGTQDDVASNPYPAKI